MPSEHMPFPDCSATELSNSLYQTGVVSVIADGLHCQDYFLLNQVENHLQHRIHNKVSTVCLGDIICSVDKVNVDCDQTSDENEEKYNIISRKRRAASYGNPERPHKQERTLPHPDEISLVTDFPTEVEIKAEGNFSHPPPNDGNQIKHATSISPHNLILDIKASNKSRNSNAGFTNTESRVIEVEFELAGNRNMQIDPPEELPQQELLKRVQDAMNVLEAAAERGELDLSLGSKHVKIKNLRFKRSHPKFVCEPGYVAEGNRCIKCPVGTFFNVLSELCDGCSLGTYQFQEGQLSCLVCPERTSTVSGQSKSVGECRAQCLPGSFSPTGLEVCETCPRGYFQPLYAQTSCIQCPASTTTWRRGARREEECQDPCPPGHVSKTGLAPCFSCPIGYFQPAAGEKACYRCPNGALTSNQGSTSVTNCAGIKEVARDSKLTIPFEDLLPVNDCFSVPCLNGATCKALEFGFLCYCIPGYTGIYCETEINECETMPCQNSGTCFDLLNGFTCNCQPGFTGNLCQKDIDECAYEPCFNGGTCTDEINKFSCKCVEGFVGPVCQYNIDDCLSHPCQNGATCEDLTADYKCRCPQGFTGVNCETNIDDCASYPCKNNGSCTDGIEDFLCQCLPGYKGRLCEEDVNECQSEPCMNGATCLDKIAHFTCLCPPSFTGDLCETELPQDFFLVFPSSGTLDFVQLDDFRKSLSQLTVCMWMKTLDKANYGTPISYANETADNLLTLTDYNGFVFYINMQEVVTDVTANDGRWHHICVTWSSENGTWSIYKDGEQADKGTGLATGTFIPANGSLVLGQEQDCKGSGFSAAESFIGSLSLLHIWDHVLTQEEISIFITSCSNYIGNVIAWSDFLGGIRGRVEKRQSDFCEGCKDPKSPDHGDVAFSGVKTNALATYSCHSGYNIEGSPSQKCMVYGDWSGDPPTCSRISCEYPGYISNGYINGRKYLFGDVIYYSCNPGYQLIGGESRICQADGYWNGTTPSCEEILCTPPSVLGNGKVTTSLNKFKPGHKVHFQCNEGYRLDGSPSLHCGSDGQWNQTQPVCQPKSCESPPRVIHGYVIGKQEKFDVGSVVLYRCDEGYVLNGSSEIRCALKNRWEGSIPRCEKINCGPPPIVKHAVVQGKDFKFGGIVTYYCDHGYEIASSDQLVCQSNGSWTDNHPRCNPVRCPQLTSPDNGYVEVTDYTFSNVAKYHCNTGYELQGIRSRKCRASKDWSGEGPTCVPVTCSQPESIPNGKYIGNDWTVGNTVSYTCRPGYMLMGEADRVCLETGQWLHSTPTCEPIECRPPDAVQHARIHGKDYHFGQRVQYQCEVGYELVGKAIRVCLEDQRWGPEPPICRPVSCGPPTQVENGEVIATNHSYTGRASYRCHLGFRLEGSQIQTCLAEGKWSEESPSCTIIKCAKPSQVQHAYLIFSDIRYGSVVEYYCDEGYKLEGSVQRICREDGYWEGNEPSCQTIRCPLPPNTEFADVKIPDNKFGSVISYSCHHGYELDGPTNRTCQQDETWSGRDPHCLPIYCPSEDLQLPNGNVILESNLMGSAVLYACDTGYELIGETSRTCLQNKKWEGTAPECKKISCPPPMPPLNGEVVWKDHSFGEIITYSCHKGHIMHGDVNRTCLPDGTWSKTEPRCDPITCSKPESIDFGNLRYDSLNYRSKVKYSCHYGYKLIGSKYMECRANQTWSGTIPKCIQILCPEPPSIMYGHHTTKNFTIGSKASYVCDFGFNMNQSELMCDSSGNWIGNAPSCNIAKCEAPPNLKFGKIIGNNHTFGNTLNFICNPGWELIGEKSIYCEATGLWNATYPSCIGTYCHSPEHIDHGEITISDLKYGTVITYRCHFGYQIVGSVSRSCQIDNTWSGNPPKCLPIPCSQPKEIKHGSRTGDKFEYGSNITYSCNYGYMLHGTKILYCLENGTWSSPPPLCVEVSCLIPDLIKNGEVVVPIRSRLFQGDEGMQGDDSTLNAAQRGDITISHNMVIEKSQSDIFRLGARVIYKCNKGYYLEGERMRTCQENGQWSGATPHCRAISCGNVDEIANGNYSVSTKTFLSYANYSCYIGYKLEGPSTRMCLSNGSWSGTLPQCIRIMCPPLPPVLHGSVKWDLLSYGGVATYECLPGYRLLGNLSRTCQQEESWSGSEPICQELLCKDPDVPENGWAKVESLKVGGTAKYGCKKGYELRGASARTCLMNETWSSYAPACDIISCPPISKLKYGQVIAKNFTFGALVSYRCNFGYKLEGSSHQTCLADKSWSNGTPSCHPLNCSMPLSPNHGSVHAPVLTIGSYANYTCHEGYELYPNYSQVCLPNLTWSGEVPVCQLIHCPPITKLQYGSVVYSTFTFGSTVEFTCHPNYQLEGARKVWCLQNKEWSFPVPECKRYICILPNAPKFSVLKPKGPHLIGDIIRYSCITGYRLNGNDIQKCNQEGQWEGILPTCSLVDCGPPPVIANGRVAFLTNTSTKYKSQVAYNCNEGYELQGSSTLLCESSGIWIGEHPKCTELSCGPPPAIVHSTVQVEHLPGLSTAFYYCNQGYKLVGSMKHTCKGGTEWNINNTYCEKIQCRDPPSVQYSTVQNDLFDIGSVALYTCSPGYYRVDTINLRCSPEGRWVGQPPRCLPIHCPSPPILKNGMIQGKNYTFESLLIYKCNKGYQLHGESYRICQADGQWSNDDPECYPIICSDVIVPDNGFVWKDKQSQHSTVGDRIGFTCKDGYMLVGSEYSQCDENGVWKPDIPYCKGITCSPPISFPLHAVIIKHTEMFSFGDHYTYLCEPGYRAEGDLTIKCLQDGSWSKTDGHCSKVSCGRPRVNNGAVVLGMSYKYLDKVVVSCPPGTKTDDNSVLTCLGDGKWTNEASCQALCAHQCLNGGVCIRPGVCSCPSGYAGEICQHAICIFPCLHGGTCIGPYKCSCLQGYSGSRCETAICKPHCQNRGICIAPNLCRCRANYSGSHCQYQYRSSYH